MIKTVMPGDYDWQDPQALLLDIGSRGPDSGQMRKRAAAGVFRDSDIRTDDKHSVIHLIAMGDSEVYDFNRNGDAFFGKGRDVEFPEPCGEKRAHIQCGNSDRAWTFEKYAKVYRDHKNGKDDKVCGEVMKAVHNAKMARVELLIKIPHDDPVWRTDVQKLASGEDLPWSMSCKVPGDRCSICGNFAPTKKSYCRHLKDHMSELTKQGHRVGMLNDHMVYFDISRVRVPADRIAYSLMKVASFGQGPNDRDEHVFIMPRIGKDADPGGIFGKSSEALRKLSEIEKRIEASGRSPIDGLAIKDMPALPDALVSMLGADRPRIGNALQSLADIKISLSLADFAKILLGKNADGFKGSIRVAEDMLPGVFSRMCDEDSDSLPESMMDVKDAHPMSQKMLREFDGLRDGMSLADGPVSSRVTIVALRGSGLPELKKQSKLIDETAEKLLHSYAAYKAAWCTRNGLDSDATRRAVLQHYVSS